MDSSGERDGTSAFDSFQGHRSRKVSAAGAAATRDGRPRLVEMLRRMLASQARSRPHVDEQTGEPRSKRWSSYAYEKRRRVVYWMIEVANKQGISRDTVSIAMNYFDRYTCSKRCEQVVVQIAAASALFLAAKVEEGDVLPLRSLLRFCGGCFSESQLLAMELDFLKTLRWDLRPVTPYDVMSSFLPCLSWDHRPISSVDIGVLTSEVEQLLDLAHFDFRSARYSPATHAVSALLLALASPHYLPRLPVHHGAGGAACRLYDLDRTMVMSICEEIGFQDLEGVAACAAHMKDMLEVATVGTKTKSRCSSPSGPAELAVEEARQARQKAIAEDSSVVVSLPFASAQQCSAPCTSNDVYFAPIRLEADTSLHAEVKKVGALSVPKRARIT